MRQAAHSSSKLIVPLVLTAAVLFGGASGEGYTAQAWLLAGAAICAAVCLLSWDPARATSGLAALLAFLAAYLVLGVLHLVPFPAGMVLGLPGREVIADGWHLLGVDPARVPVSMAPERTLRALGAAVLPLAAILLVYRLGWTRVTTWLAWCIVALGAASALLGFAQVLISRETDLYLYDVTSPGLPVGVFANANHQASFLLMTLPFTAALIGDTRSDHHHLQDGAWARLILLTSLGLTQLVGVLAVGSLAGYLMLGPVLIFSLLITASRRNTYSGRSSLILVAAVVAGALLVASSPVLEGLGISSFSTGGMSRLGMAGVAQDALTDHIWLGSGLGTFEPVFKLYEDPSVVTRVFANHAHNEYLQWALETGLPGLALLLVFLAWWLVAFIRVWAKSKDDTARIRKAASIVTLILFMHSFVDYPVRTPAILTLASLCLALMVLGRRQGAGAPNAGQTTRRVQL